MPDPRYSNHDALQDPAFDRVVDPLHPGRLCRRWMLGVPLADRYRVGVELGYFAAAEVGDD